MVHSVSTSFEADEQIRSASDGVAALQIHTKHEQDHEGGRTQRQSEREGSTKLRSALRSEDMSWSKQGRQSSLNEFPDEPSRVFARFG